MLSVYHHSIGRTFEIRGAPAVLLPPLARPQSLAEALDKLKGSEGRMRQALWTIARAIGPQRGPRALGGEGRLERYPREMVECLDAKGRERLKAFDGRRGRYRREAHLFGAALVAEAEAEAEDEAGGGAEDEARGGTEHAAGDGAEHDDARAKLLDDSVELFAAFADQGGGLNDATAETGILGWGKVPAGERHGKRGQTALEFLRQWQKHETPERKGAAQQLLRLEQEIGLSVTTFIEEFADSVAFAQCFPTGDGEVVTVFPTSSITVQDAESLVTRVTVTSLVRTNNFHCLRIGMDPQCWTSCSSAFSTAGYLADPFKVGPPKPAPEPGYYGWTGRGPKLLEEEVTIRLGDDASRIASFHNILNVAFDPNADEKKIDLDFSLHRCIKSRILWDERPGGILVDEGYARARPLGPDLWRLTVRKTLGFSDRTPYVGGPGWNDFGQLLNYLAPAMLSWWIESEMYSATCEDIITRATKRAEMDVQQGTAEEGSSS